MKYLTPSQEYQGDSLYSPIHDGKDLSTTQYHQIDLMNTIENGSSAKSATHSQKKLGVRFSQIEETASKSYKQLWSRHIEDAENDYLSSGLNSQAELEILYAARGTEVAKLSSEVQGLKHKVALLGNTRHLSLSGTHNKKKHLL